MTEVATILMKRRSGMTAAATALAVGFIRKGMNVCFIVPMISEDLNVPRDIPRHMVRSADSIWSMTSSTPDVYIFDDAVRCAEVFRRHGEGELLDVARQRFSLRQDEVTRIYLFQYTI